MDLEQPRGQRCHYYFEIAFAATVAAEPAPAVLAAVAERFFAGYGFVVEVA